MSRSTLRRLVTGLATATALSLTASGCVTVHGELEVVPAATESEAARALKDFTAAYNKADKAYDPALDAGRVTGALGAINQAGLKARQTQSPDGNPRHDPLELTDAKFAIPKKAGWPRWFVADTDSNRDKDTGRLDTRWMLVFVRGGADQLWEVSHLSVLTPNEVPTFKKDADGWAEPVAPDAPSLVVPPKDLSVRYASYLQDGKPENFAPGPHTSAVRQAREKSARQLGRTVQYRDQQLDTGTFAPLGLVTADGGATVFFATRQFEQQTVAQGVRLDLNADVRALMTGTARTKLTKERVSSQVAQVPAKDAAGGSAGAGKGAPQVTVLARIQGLTAAQGS
ncbi:hypothetical protein [Streptomyces chryseus]|uniref:Lipoprotein n=1 Tax=Streptomyces chryseus TaxID=68186 RepID=A0ABQ3DDZ0_9ACTN|nr:hypothetical protein [Streptomyces chryseus]GGX12028.1 putative lipoprotein [Streptomyces chryseus]GHA85843.1 putative lipoprotein [Streptomyces chryseus]